MPIGFKPEDKLGLLKRRLGWGLVLSIAFGCAFLGFLVYALTHRYTLATTADGAVYRTDRLTGKTWRVEGESMKEVVEVKPTPTHDPDASQEIPVDDIVRLQGKGDCVYKFGEWRFEATVNNPT